MKEVEHERNKKESQDQKTNKRKSNALQKEIITFQDDY